jgi:glycosyltransferase involved in cell wall biosynthesis
LVVPPKDPASMAVAMSRLMMDPALRERLGQNGRQQARAEYADEQVASLLDLRLRELVKKFSADESPR